jgi:hypothetical protein
MKTIHSDFAGKLCESHRSNHIARPRNIRGRTSRRHDVGINSHFVHSNKDFKMNKHERAALVRDQHASPAALSSAQASALRMNATFATINTNDPHRGNNVCN